MGINTIYPWLKNKNLLKQISDFSKMEINTLFIDASELLIDDIKKYGKEDKIPHFLKEIKEIIKLMNPKDEIFFSLDGPNPAAKFQHERRNLFYVNRNLIDDFIYPTEEVFKQMQENDQKHDKGISQFLPDFFTELLKNETIQTNKILYSGRYSPGESEHKYFQYFRDQKQANQLKPNQNHFIFSNDNDLIFLALQFIDENFYIIKYDREKDDTFFIIDISELRITLLNEIKKAVGKSFNEKRVIDDVIALSFILGNDFVPRFPDIEEDPQTFDQLLKAYDEMNQEDAKSNYDYLINNDSFDVSVLKRIVSHFFTDNYSNRHFIPFNSHYSQTNLPQNSKYYHHPCQYFPHQCSRISSLNNNVYINKFRSQMNLPQNNKFHYSYENKDNSNLTDSQSISESQFLNDDDSSYQINDDFHYSYTNNNHENRIKSLNTNIYHLPYMNRHQRFQNNENQSDSQQNDDFHYSYSNNYNQQKQTNSHENENAHYHYYTDQEKLAYKTKMAQSILRIFNFTWLYYVHGVPSWTYYYPYTHSPRLQDAVNLMTQEGKEYFTDLKDNEITDPLLKSLIIYPITKTSNIPWEIYKLKIPPSSLADKYFPLSSKAPIFDLDEIKKSYKVALQNLSNEEQIYNRREKPFVVFSKY